MLTLLQLYRENYQAIETLRKQAPAYTTNHEDNIKFQKAWHKIGELLDEHDELETLLNIEGKEAARVRVSFW